MVLGSNWNKSHSSCPSLALSCGPFLFWYLFVQNEGHVTRLTEPYKFLHLLSMPNTQILLLLCTTFRKAQHQAGVTLTKSEEWKARETGCHVQVYYGTKLSSYLNILEKTLELLWSLLIEAWGLLGDIIGLSPSSLPP